MPRTIPSAATLAKNALDAGKPLYELWKVQVGASSYLYLVNHPQSIVYGGNTYQPYPIQRHEEEQPGTGKLAQLVVLVSNVTREVQSYIEADVNGLRGKKVERRIVDDTLAWEILDSYIIDSCEADEKVASFVLAKPVPAFELKFPMLVVNRDDFPGVTD